MTTSFRTESDLLHELARTIDDTGKPLHDCVLSIMHDEHHDRYVNFITALATELQLTDQDHVINRFDVDHLPDPTASHRDEREDHPASYAMRLTIWAARYPTAQLARVIESLAQWYETEAVNNEHGRAGGAAYRAAAVLFARLETQATVTA